MKPCNMLDLHQFLHEQKGIEVIDLKNPRYVALDLSVNNSKLTAEVTSDSAKLGNYIDDYLHQHQANAAYGGYDERRAIYQRSDIFLDDESPERDIHIGLDIWAPSGTKVLAALDGIVHSTNFNSGKGNYGPTVILQHNFEHFTFYTLYGHLDTDCLLTIVPGEEIKMGAAIGALGDESVNGDYPPHLHFQVIIDIGNNKGDYPGVCSKADRDYFLSNCPDPNILLKIIQT